MSWLSEREKCRNIKAFGIFARQPDRQPARQPSGNGLLFLLQPLRRKPKLFHFLCGDFLKTVHAVVRLVVIFDTLPALLAAVRLREVAGIGKRPPAGNGVVHNIVDFPQFPLFRLVIVMSQCFPVKLFGADYAEIFSLMTENLASMTILFYGFAVYEGYKFSFRAQNQPEGGKI